MRIAFLLVLALLQTASPGRTGVEGIVKAAIGGQEPLSDARVELFDGPGAPLVIRTNAEGRFSFSNLIPGRFRLRVTKDGFLRQEYGERALGIPGLGLVLSAGQPKTDAAFLLDRAPTIAGRVTDEFGEGKPYVLVQALRSAYSINVGPGQNPPVSIPVIPTSVSRRIP